MVLEAIPEAGLHNDGAEGDVEGLSVPWPGVHTISTVPAHLWAMLMVPVPALGALSQPGTAE